MISKFILLSDIHLENHDDILSFEDLLKKFPSLTRAQVNDLYDMNLLLAGDIGHPTNPIFWKFIESCSKTFKNVIYVAGNHEFYNKLSIDQVLNHIKLQAIEINKTHSNFYFLDKSEITIDGVRLLGTTLWSMIPSHVSASCSLSLNDYYNIHEASTKLLTIQKTNSMHINQVIWLTRALKEDTNTPTLIMTHHLPSFKLIHTDYAQCTDLNYAYASNLEHLLQDNLKLWVCGHTHKANDMIINNTRFIINPLGYYGQNPDATLKYIELSV